MTDLDLSQSQDRIEFLSLDKQRNQPQRLSYPDRPELLTSIVAILAQRMDIAQETQLQRGNDISATHWKNFEKVDSIKITVANHEDRFIHTQLDRK